MNSHNKIKLVLKITGGALLLVGAVFAIIGFADFFSAFNGTGMPTKFWCCFVGLPLIGIGIGLLTAGFRREIMRYQKNESAPVVNEAAEDMSPAVKTVATAFREGFSGEGKRKCSCGCENDADSKFCKVCGKLLTLRCPHCGAAIAPDSIFCDECGKKVNE